MKKIWGISEKKYLLFIQIGMNMALSLITIWVSNYAKNVVDNGFDEKNLIMTLILFSGMTLMGILFSYIGIIVKSNYAIGLTEKLRNALASKMLKCKYSYFENEHSGSLKNKMNYDMGNVANYMAGGLPEFVGNIVVFVCSFIYLLTVNLSMTLVCSICVPLAIVLSKKVAAPTYNTMELFDKKLDVVAEIAQDSVIGEKVEKAYNLHETRRKYFNENMDEATHYFREYEKLVIKAGPYKYLIKSAPTFICIIIGFYNAYSGSITSGEFIAFILMMKNITRPLSELPRHATEFKEAAVSIDRVLGLLAYEDEKFGTQSSLVKQDCVFELENVTFSYSNDSRNVLDGVNFKISSGKSIALVGSSGNGKSTIFKLLLGFHTPTKGVVKLYGKDLNEWDITKAREQISYVSQNTYLFNGSVAENIAYGKKDATFEEIVEASKKAYAHEFIMEMPNGYQTILAEYGDNLSGGQKQRISIARAFLKDAPIFVLDEMTSALDVESEKFIQNAIEAYRHNKTVIIIAHRLSTIINSDEILVLHGGAIAEIGNHRELLNLGKIYSSLYKKQEK